MENTSKITFKTGIFGEKNFKILDAVAGQISDGKWENTPGMNKYWENNTFVYNPDTKEVELKMEISVSQHNTNWNNRTHHLEYGIIRYVYNPFIINGKMIDGVLIKKFYARKIKSLAKDELGDTFKTAWNATNNTILDCFDDGVTGITAGDVNTLYKVMK